jgi:mannosyl-oligosaccharide glucosidase
MAVTAFIERLRKLPSAIDTQLGVDSDFASHQTTFNSPPTPTDSNKLLLDRSAALKYLRSIYPALRRHYHWFRRTQRGQIKQWGRKARSRAEAYRWRGRSETHVLTSGLDDYPRAEKPHVGELHVDLISWMGSFTRTIREVAEFLEEEEDVAEYTEIEGGILANIDGKSFI